MNPPTAEQMRVAIAECVGWKRVPNRWATTQMWANGLRQTSELPNYPASLDAMHEAEKVLPAHQREEYWLQLSMIVNKQHRMTTTAWLCLTATANQRATAFLRVTRPEMFKE